MERRRCTSSDQHSSRWKGEDTRLLVSAVQAVLGRANWCHFQQSHLVAFPWWRQTIAMHTFCQAGTRWPNQEPALLEALPSSLNAPVVLLMYMWHLELGGVAAIIRESPFSLKSDNILPAPLMENLQYYHKSRDIRHRSPPGIKKWKCMWFGGFLYFCLSMYCFYAMPVLPWEHWAVFTAALPDGCAVISALSRPRNHQHCWVTLAVLDLVAQDVFG